MSDDTSDNGKPTGLHWANQSKLLIQRVEEIMKDMLPCPVQKVIAEVKYQTGLSNNKATEFIKIFIEREKVIFEEMDYKGKNIKCMRFIDG